MNFFPHIRKYFRVTGTGQILCPCRNHPYLCLCRRIWNPFRNHSRSYQESYCRNRRCLPCIRRYFGSSKAKVTKSDNYSYFSTPLCYTLSYAVPHKEFPLPESFQKAFLEDFVPYICKSPIFPFFRQHIEQFFQNHLRFFMQRGRIFS